MNCFRIGIIFINLFIIAGLGCASTVEPSPDVVSEDGSNMDDSTNLPDPNAPDESAPDESKPCNDQCAPAGKSECRDKSIFSCQPNEQGCNVWVQTKTCGAHQTCIDSSGTAVCQCNHECTIENSPLCQNKTTTTCRKDADGCSYWEQTKQCGGKCCPLVLVQLHTWWSTPWTKYGAKNWGYWKPRSDMNPDNLYTDSTWQRRIIGSLSYPYPYNQNQSSQNLYEFFKEGTANVINIQYAGSYPFLCPYDSTNEDVIRYQIQAAKAAGIDAFAVSVFDVYADNRVMDGQAVCPAAQNPYQPGGMDRFNLYLAVAEQESFKIFLEIWVPANDNAAPEECGSIASWVYTMSLVINETANSPAYLRINDQPVVSPHWFAVKGDDWIFQKSINQVYWNTNQQDIFWLVRGSTDDIIAYTQPDPVEVNFIDAIAVGKILQANTLIALPNYDLQINQILELKQNHSNRVAASHIYPAFDDTFREGLLYYQNYYPMTMKRVDIQGKNAFQSQLQNSIANGADILFIESWNDYQEQTFIEPARVVNGVEQTDPFVDLKTLANSQGMTFVAPSLPPMGSLDPLCIF